MNLNECLSERNLDELKAVAKRLHRLDDKDPELSAIEYKRRIKDELLNHLWRILSENIPEESDVMVDLKNLCLGIKDVNRISKNTLCSLGILYKNDIIPDEIKNILFTKWREGFIKSINDPIFKVIPSAFLRLTMILRVIEGGYIERYEELINLKFSDEFSTKELVEYLISSDIITLKSEDTIQVQNFNLKVMRNDKLSFMKDFYDKLILKNNPVLCELLSLILTIQENHSNWVSLKDCGSISYKFANDIELLIDLGCLLHTEENNENFVQLAPDMWYILTGKHHKLWELDGVIITPDFEVFIPYFFDPLVIDMLNHYGDSLNMKITCSEVKVKGNVRMSKGRRVQRKLKRVCIGYGNDYFFVYNIENCKNKDSGTYSFNQFCSYLQRCMPDIVRYNLMAARSGW